MREKYNFSDLNISYENSRDGDIKESLSDNSLLKNILKHDFCEIEKFI